jgi:phospholipase C
MTDTRREFLKKAGLLTGAAGLFNLMPAAIQKALAINAAPGSTFMDAEHIVFLMQENRSFDHCFGTLKGVRGFNDPRAICLANNNPVWLQSNSAGHTYAPFRLNLKDSKATWMNSLPHSWENQVDARNNGQHNKWLDSKKSGNKDFADMPLTMGYYNREDIPFYYALADAFTVCDQHFCSSLTGTSPNRLYFFSGTVRAEQQENSKAHVWNHEIDHKDLSWTTFPERLEEMGISWKAYQNELSIPVGFKGEEDDWLSNFTDNDLEFFKQYNVRLHPSHLTFLSAEATRLQQEISQLTKQMETAADKSAFQDKIAQTHKYLATIQKEQLQWNQEKFDQLSEKDKSIHRRAFTTNKNDPDYHELVDMAYEENGVKRNVKLPKGDILHQFRTDVNAGQLPTVSWLVPPANFSDHPGSPWYGAWYISEVMDILTKNEEVWKKTIFIITYDENDGYFDHVPPFLPPDTANPQTGKASAGIDTSVEHVSMDQEMKRGISAKDRRESAIGLGYRVPMLVISPWTKGGWVNSQVFDHTSCLQFMERFLSQKTGKSLLESQISSWRRTVCGDLTSVFRVAEDTRANAPKSLEKDQFIQGIYNAKFKSLPNGFQKLSDQDLHMINQNPLQNPMLPQQEKGIRRSTALPYELYVHASLDNRSKNIRVEFESGTQLYGKNTAGAPYIMYFPGNTLVSEKGQNKWAKMNSRYYAVKAGDKVVEELPLSMFEHETYHLQVYGPNGFFREFKGDAAATDIDLSCAYESDSRFKTKLTGNMVLKVSALADRKKYELIITDNAYHRKPIQIVLNAEAASVKLELSGSHSWYDFSVRIKGKDNYEQRYAGRVETGSHGFSDPFMGRV